MLLSELMESYASGINADFEGELMADDYVLAINVKGTEGKTDITSYAVVQEHITGVDSSLNASTNDKQYIRSGTSSTKKDTQRSFSISGDRYIGDEAQDYMESVKYKTGSDAVTEYVFFNLKNGKGEQGTVTISVDNDGGGNAGDNATVSYTLSKNGAAPTDYTYSATVGS